MANSYGYTYDINCMFGTIHSSTYDSSIQQSHTCPRSADFHPSHSLAFAQSNSSYTPMITLRYFRETDYVDNIFISAEVLA